jgi:hypothetical protein
LAANERKSLRLVLAESSDASLEQGRIVACIRVSEEEELAFGNARTLEARPWLSEPPSGQHIARDDANGSRVSAGNPASSRGCVVRRSVVHDRYGEGGILL